MIGAVARSSDPLHSLLRDSILVVRSGTVYLPYVMRSTFCFDSANLMWPARFRACDTSVRLLLHNAALATMIEIPDDDYIAPNDVWDAGELECGELLLPLRDRVAALPEDGVLKLTTRASAASLDLLAWCRSTGHRMLKAAPPDFYIQRNARSGP